MSRSSKKGPWVEERLMARIEAQNSANTKTMVKTWSRTSTIFPEMVGHTIAVHDGRKRHMGVRPQTRGTAMNPVDHPHGGGEGSTTAGRHPVTPWGVPTLGYRTRKKNKSSDRYIVRGRRRGKGKNR